MCEFSYVPRTPHVSGILLTAPRAILPTQRVSPRADAIRMRVCDVRQAELRCTAGCWSPTRPAVLYLALNSGGVEAWDLVDRTHEPASTWQVGKAMKGPASVFRTVLWLLQLVRGAAAVRLGLAKVDMHVGDNVCGGHAHGFVRVVG